MLTMKTLSRFGAGLNIEGGFPCRDLPRTSLWANAILVLDRPLIDLINFDEIVKNNPYPLLENAIPEINEKQFLVLYLSIIEFYLKNGPKLLNKANPTMIIHIHQDPNCAPLIKILTDLLIKRGLSVSSIKFETDKPNYQSMNHGKYTCDILISLSQCAGLDPDVPAGSMLISDTFIPLDLDNSMLLLDEKYTVKNSLMEHLPQIFEQDVEDVVNFINSEYVSFNPNKHSQMAIIPKPSDFIRTNIIQVDKLWNPEATLAQITISQPNPKLVQRLSSFVSDVCKGRDESHGLEHMKEVSELALEIAIGENASEQVIRLCQIVAWLHDVNDHKYDFDGKLGEKVKVFLEDLIGAEEAERVLMIIDRISFSKEVKHRKEGTWNVWMDTLSQDELQTRNIVSDADKCTALGAKGFERCCEFSKERLKGEYSEREVIKNVVIHSFEKLLKLKDDYLRTLAGKRLAKPLHDELLGALQQATKTLL